MLEACLAWIAHDAAVRAARAEDLIMCVRLDRCSAMYLKDAFREHESWLSSPKTQKQLIVALMEIATTAVVRSPDDPGGDPDPASHPPQHQVETSGSKTNVG